MSLDKIKSPQSSGIKLGMKKFDVTTLLSKNLQKSKYAPALAAGINKKQSAWIMSKGSNTQKMAGIKSIITNATIAKQTGTPLTQDQYSSLVKTNTAFQGTITKGNMETATTIIDPLSKGTVESVVLSEQLADVIGKYFDLLNAPPKEGTIDIKKLLVYGGIAVFGLIALSMFTRNR